MFTRLYNNACELITSAIHTNNVFQQTIYALYRNPILFLMPSIGFAISTVTETIFVTGLYNNNSPNYFPFSNFLVTVLFFVGFAITYFQLIITRNIILKKRLRSNNSVYRNEILVLFIIYSVHALILIQMGGYESEIRKRYVFESDRFSLYTVKLKSYSDIIAVVPEATGIIVFSAIFTLFFYSWMATVVSRYQMTNMGVLYSSLRDLISVFTRLQEHKMQMKRMTSLFLFTSLITDVGYILSNIAVISVASSLNLYLYQFVISSIIGTLYWPFFLTALFLILSPRTNS